jgi:transposase
MEETIAMTKKELERIKILSQVMDGKISQVLAAKKLGLSDRQIRRLLLRLKTNGDKSIISKKRGKPSNNCLSKQLKTNILSLIQNHYVDFGPKLANEYLKKEHNISISTETLRLWMIETHLWISKNRRDKKLHLPRKRRNAFGELIQIDGSHHDWFGATRSC